MLLFATRGELVVRVKGGMVSCSLLVVDVAKLGVGEFLHQCVTTTTRRATVPGIDLCKIHFHIQLGRSRRIPFLFLCLLNTPLGLGGLFVGASLTNQIPNRESTFAQEVLITMIKNVIKLHNQQRQELLRTLPLLVLVGSAVLVLVSKSDAEIFQLCRSIRKRSSFCKSILAHRRHLWQ